MLHYDLDWLRRHLESIALHRSIATAARESDRARKTNEIKLAEIDSQIIFNMSRLPCT